MSHPLRIAWLGTDAQVSAAQAATKGEYFAAMLRQGLGLTYDIEYFSARQLEQDLAAPLRQHQQNPYNFFVFHVEDSPSLRAVRLYAGMVPGVCLFFDVFVQDTAENRELVSIQQHVRQALGLPRLGEPEPSFVRLELASAALAIACTERGVTELRTRSKLSDGRKRVWQVPYPVPVHNRPSSGATVAFCGGPELEFRAPHLLAALEGTGRELCWVCESVEHTTAKQLCQRFDVPVTFLVPRTPERWAEALRRASVAVHTWYSAYGDPEPFLSLSMAAGVPTIVHQFSATEVVPDWAAHKVLPGVTETAQLRAALSERFESAASNAAALRVQQQLLEFANSTIVVSEILALFSEFTTELSDRTEHFFAKHGLDTCIGLLMRDAAVVGRS